MEYIKRSPEPEYLSKNKVQWTKPWVDFYRKKIDGTGKRIRDTKPSDSHWTKDKIRKILISDFKNNCGYCGCSRPTPKSAHDKQTSPRGHVDHYKAKAIYPESTYKWGNYIWSCEACNVEKGEFDDPQYPILNPCDLEDCSLLKFIVDTGEYCLHDQESIYKERFINTDQSTMLNAEEIIIRRRNRVKKLKSLFNSIFSMLKILDCPAVKTIIDDNITLINNDLEDCEFYFLIRKEYNSLRNQYPKIAVLIDAHNI